MTEQVSAKSAPAPSAIQIECHRDDLELSAVAALAEVTLRDVARGLAIDVSGLRPMRVIVGDRENRMVDREIRVAPRLAGRGYSTYDWFELLFAHEVTHLLIHDAWGLPPVLWWEGLAVHLGDDRVRTRLFGHDYHAWCRGLAELDRLLPLEPLLRASTYYRRRGDIRVDLQAGSFSGFLLRTRGPGRLASFFLAARPITDARTVDLALRSHLGADLEGLRTEWVRFLATEVERVPSIVDRLRAHPCESAPDARERCDRCFEVQVGPRGCQCVTG